MRQFGDLPIMTSHGPTSGQLINYDDFVAANTAQVSDFQTKVNQFNALFSKLASYDPSTLPADLNAEYTDLINRGQTLKNTIIAVGAKIDAAKNWVTDAVGLSGLGFAPVVYAVSAAAILGATAMLGKWISDAYITTKKIDSMNQLIANGTDPATAAQMVNSVDYSGFSLSTLLANPFTKYALIGGAVLLFMHYGKRGE